MLLVCKIKKLLQLQLTTTTTIINEGEKKKPLDSNKQGKYNKINLSEIEKWDFDI